MAARSVLLAGVLVALLAGGAQRASAETYEHAVETTSGVAHFWPMGEASGSSFADVIGAANAEVLGGVSLGEPGALAGDAATSALFNGSSGSAQASVDLSGTKRLTVEFWMKWKAFAENDDLAMEFTPNFNETPGGFLIDPNTAEEGGKFGVGVGEGGTRNNVYFARPSAEQWHYYAFVIDTEGSAATEITPYIDGHSVSYTKTSENSGGSFAKSTLYWMSRDASSLFGSGSMQDLALYEKTLSSETILEHYELGAGLPEAAFNSSPAVATVGVPVHFDASASSTPAGSLTDYAWDFDGSKSYATDSGSSATTSHTFSTAGSYTVDLRVENSDGKTATVSHTITVGAALGPYEQAVEETSNATHFWLMGEASGSSFADVIGAANAEVLGGVSLGEPGALAGDAATSALFNGSSGAARANIDLSGTKRLTVEFWMKWKAFAGNDDLAMEFTPNFNETPGGFLVDPNTAEEGGKFGVGVGEGGSRNNVYFARPSAEQWHYYAFVINTEGSAATEITPYIDGHAVSYTKTSENSGGSFANSTLYWMSRDASSLFGSGAMQDLALYEKTLSAETILEHYELGAGVPEALFSSSPAVATVGVPVRLDASASSTPAGSLTDYAWDFDGSKSYATDSGGSATTSHTFSTAGSYTVDLRVENSDGKTATVSHTITVGAALGAYEQAVEDSTGVSHFWPMGEASGSSFADVVGGADAEVSGGVSLGEPGALAGDAATSALFNGSSGSAQASVDLSGTKKLTVEFWMKWKAFAGNDDLAMEFTPNFNEAPGGFLIDPNTAEEGGKFGVGVGEGGTRNNVYFARPSAEQWHYYAFVIDTEGSAATEITPYIDGHSVSYTKTSENSGGSFAKSTLYWMSRDASSLFGPGSMQDLALYEKTLSAETILEHYELGRYGTAPINTEAPSIEGTVQDGQTLLANPGSWSGAEPVVFGYQWESCNAEGDECQVIAEASDQYYTVVSADLESTLRVRVTATHAGNVGQASSSATSQVEAGPPSELEAPSISGVPSVGEALEADAGSWGGSEVEVAYQWEECDEAGVECASIPGATEARYEPREADLGHTIRVRVGVSNPLGALTDVSSPTAVVETASLLVNTWAPSITGTPQNGETLSANAGSWLGSATITYGYQWQLCDRYGEGCENIAGATASSYTLGSGDVGDTVRVVASATGVDGTASEVSAATLPIAQTSAPVVDEAPVIYGTGLEGFTLSATRGSWSGAGGVTYSYQWVRCDEQGEACSSISGATASSLTLTEADVMGRLRVLVTASNGAANTVAGSSGTAVISAAALVDDSAPSISGIDQAHRVLTSDPGIWTGAGAIAFSFQWMRCDEEGETCEDEAGATEAAYVPSEVDAGKTVRVLATATGSSGSPNVLSAATPLISSESVEPENTEAPSIEGNLTAGDTLAVQPGAWLGSEPISYSYRWELCEEAEECAAIAGATSATYVLTEADIDASLRVQVTASNAAGSASATSAVSETVDAAGAPENSRSPMIYGTARQGERLFVDNGSWSGSRPLHYFYWWERCDSNGESCGAIEGATKPSYLVLSGDVGSTLRVGVTVTNTLGNSSVRSVPVSVQSGGEAAASEALEVAEANSPSVLSPSSSTTLEEQTVKPAISDAGEELTSSGTLTSSTISKETPGEFAVNTRDGQLSLMPVSSSSHESTTPTIVNGAAALYAEISQATDTIVRPEPLGATTILQLRNAEAPTSFSWELGLGPDQKLEELPDGSVAVTEPAPAFSLESPITGEPLEETETPETIASPSEHTGETGGTGEAAEEEFSGSLEETPVEKLAAAPKVSTAATTPKPGELQPQKTLDRYESAISAMEYAQSHTENTTVMVIQSPVARDADDKSVAASLSVAGDTITMTVESEVSTPRPISVETPVSAPTDTDAATAGAGYHYGLSDPKPEVFAEKNEKEEYVDTLDPKLITGPMKITTARGFFPYNTEAESPKLVNWLKAVGAAKLTPYITLTPLGVSCSRKKPTACSKPPKEKEYRKAVSALISNLALGDAGKGIPPVTRWGAWNEPNLDTRVNYNPTYTEPWLAAEYWQIASKALHNAGCITPECVVAAGEFAAVGNKYITRYLHALRKHKNVWSRKPRVWGLHDYSDLQPPYGHRAAKQFEQLVDKRGGRPRIWLSEQGVLLADGKVEPTAQGKTVEEAQLKQRKSAQDFLTLHEATSQIELVNYYLYEGPSKTEVEKEPYTFDSALRAGVGVSNTLSAKLKWEPNEPREAYCVLVNKTGGCPAEAATKAAVGGTIGSSGGTMALDVAPHGAPTSYWVEYGLSSSYGATTSAVAVANDNGRQSETIALTELEPCTTYHYQAEAENEANEGEPALGGDVTFKTAGCDATALANGWNHSCALLSSGKISCWGVNSEGELGDDTTEGSLVPVSVDGITNASAVTAGAYSTCALLSDGTVSCWGEIGEPPEEEESGGCGCDDVMSSAASDLAPTAGEAGSDSTLTHATRALGPRLDDVGGETSESTTPVIVSGISDAVAVNAGESSACAVIADGSVDCWGDNDEGQLGDGTTETSLAPVEVTGLSTATSVAVGDGGFACAVLSDGGVDCWGANEEGQLGNGSTEDSPTPVEVSGISDATAVTAGDEQACALRSAGGVKCWGANDAGELGNGTTVRKSTPVAVSSLTDAIQVSAAGVAHVCAARSAGGVECWGANDEGQLGDGTTVKRTKPVGVAGLTDSATAGSGGIDFSCALLSSGTVECWGFDGQGQLGNGSTTHTFTPVKVSGIE